MQSVSQYKKALILLLYINGTGIFERYVSKD